MFNIRAKWFTPVLLLFMCVQIVVGSTLAYFVDEVSTTGNIVTAGRLKAGMDWAAEMPSQESDWQDASTGTIFDERLWEPGFTSVRYVRVRNEGTLAFQYELNLVPDYVVAGGANLLDVIDVYFGVMGDEPITRANYTTLNKVGVLSDLLKNENGAGFGIMLPEKGAKDAALPSGVTAYTGSEEFVLVLHMQETAGNEYMNASVGDGFKLQLVATQYTYEKDAFGNDYDTEAELPDVFVPTHMVINVTPDENGLVPQDVEFVDGNGTVTAVVPAGAKMAEGATQLRLIIETKDRSDANVHLDDDQVLTPYEVRIEGLAKDNTVPARITMAKAMTAGLNIGNYTLYHVENGVSNVMTRQSAIDASSAHNTFAYDPATGDVSVAMATFSEVTCVVDKIAPWEGKFDYTWYDASKTELTIANADQLAAFGAIVGGMDGQTKDSFSGKTVKLISDINLGDKESENNPDLIFYPIGYYNSEGTYERTNTGITSGLRNFEGTFDGNGHTIANFYHNTWEMKGDHDWYSPEEQYYRDGMGLFGRVYKGTVKNLTVDHFSSDGEIATTGVIAAYVDGATFENIAITNCNPRVYNIGNGGIVGCVGWYAKEADLKTTFKNITVDNSNKISALWGSYDVACGGLVGQYYPTSGQTSAGTPKNGGISFENCHVSAIMDVYNDVCANYQYYAYRYAGMIIGSIRENTTNADGKTIPDMTGITAENCTVNYGDWNDYYYCEFEKNGHPSYSGPDDYKFSRVPHSELDFTDSNGNGLVDADERASVTGCKHNHTDAEDNQAIYLPFHQLFTGYGWGVSSIGLEKYSGIVTNLDITEGDQQESVVKFEGKVTNLVNNKSHKLGDIFTFVDNGVELKLAPLTVTVTNIDESNPVSATVVYDSENWENGTITFTGVGVINLTIQDYYFCTPTTITVTIAEPDAVSKFEAKDNLTFVHTVEGGTIEKTLGDIFQAIEGADINSAMVEVTIDSEDKVFCKCTPHESDWTKSTLEFEGAGTVTLTITDKNYCIETPATVTIAEPDHVDKFEPVNTGVLTIVLGYDDIATKTLGEIFKAIDDAVINSAGVTVNVTPEGEEESCQITPYESDWMQSTLTFTGAGSVMITITDNNYCKPCTATVEVVEPDPIEKFASKFTGDFLYRVGNQNAVSLNSLFEESEALQGTNAKIAAAEVTIETINGTGASGAYTANDDWTKGTIQFSGTGVVKVTIKDDDKYCTPTVLYLEVVNAYNVTTATHATDKDIVLLNNTSASSLNISNGYAFYGNGFEVKFTGDGSYRSAALSYGFVTIDKGGILDNTQIICNIFPESYLYTNEMKAGSDGRYPYGYSAVVISGNSTISNSYIYGARNNIQVGEGNVTIENTVTECGSLSNIHIRSSNASYTVTLKDVTTIQYQTTSSYDTSKTVLGFGIVVGDNDSESNPTIKLEGDLKQYNWVSSADTNNVSNSYAKTAITNALKETDYQKTLDGATTVNMGIVYLNTKTAKIEDGRTNKTDVGYVLNNISMSTYTGQVYSIASGASVTPVRYTKDNAPTYYPKTNGLISPVAVYDGVNGESILMAHEYNTDAWINKLSVDLDKISGGSYAFNFSELKVQKYGINLGFTVKDENGNTVNKDTTITLNQLTSKTYTLVVIDDQLYDAKGKLSDESVTVEIPFVLNATKTSIDPPKFTNAGTATAIRLVDKAGGDWRPAYTVLTGVTVTYWSASEGKVKTVDLSTIYNKGTSSSNVWTYTCDDYTLTITGGAVHSDGTKITPVVSNNTLYFASTNKAFTTGTTSRDIILTYVFTDKNASTTWNRTEKVTYSNVSEYDYSKFKNGTLEAPSSSGGGSCLAEGTMITLADGTKRAVEDLRKGDMVMVFDHLTGEVTANKVIIVVKTGGEFYENTFVFDDGTELVTINEHGIYDLNLKRYVNIDHLNAEEFIGHDFVSIDVNGQVGTKKLVAVESEFINGYKYDIVSETTLNYVAEDTLSVTHELVGVINTFDFNDEMCYDQAKMAADIQQYGLYEYEEWQEYADSTVFEEYNIPVMKVGISKGLYTQEHIIGLINTFVLDDSVQILD